MNPLVAEATQFAIINAAGFSTRVGGSCPAPEVIEAMTYAQSEYFEIDDLLELASRVIAKATDSEAGLVTCGAGAALTLAAAAVLARNDVETMDRLPDVSGLAKTEFIYPTRGPFDYDHPLRLCGAKLKDVEIEITTLEETLESAVGPATAGVVYVWKNRDDGSLIQAIAEACRKRNFPFILDAAMALPPEENLSHLYSLGPNLIAISGGKHLGGPQNSGLLFGDRQLIDSAWIQMVDMDVRSSSWSRQRLIDENFVSRPPRHGVGRAMKVGKDVILGCMVAVDLYAKRDFAGERARWHDFCRQIVDESKPPSYFTLQKLDQNWTNQYPVVRLQADSASRMIEFRKRLKAEPRKIILGEDESDESLAYLYPICLSEADIPIITRALTELTVA